MVVECFENVIGSLQFEAQRREVDTDIEKATRA
jgi:hypothetical protein